MQPIKMQNINTCLHTNRYQVFFTIMNQLQKVSKLKLTNKKH